MARQKFKFTLSHNESMKLENEHSPNERRIQVTFFTERGKFKYREEFIITEPPELSLAMSSYELTTQAAKFIKEYDNHRGMTAVIMFQDSDIGFPLMVPASERK